MAKKKVGNFHTNPKIKPITAKVKNYWATKRRTITNKLDEFNNEV